MNSHPIRPTRATARRAFTLVEMLVVIAIISILMTAGSIGLRGMGGKGVTSGVATVESLFDEARTTAVGRNIRSAVLVAKTLTNNKGDDLRRIVVAYEEIDPATGLAKEPGSQTPNWMLSSRGAVLPDQTFFSDKFSKKSHSGGGKIDTVPSSKLKTPAGQAVKSSYAGEYYIYRFNAQGILTDPNDANYKGGASFIIGSGARNLSQSSTAQPPRVTSAGKRDFGGFVIWRNGRTSVFRSPEQMDSKINDIKTGETF
jgi:prepilin-type N-terminal cleavage/methylation domain-containing protein